MSASRLDIPAVRTSLAARAAKVAVALLGEPNQAMSTDRDLRFGSNGSVSVMISGPKAGSWYDHESRVGGDLLALIERERGGHFRDAVEFAERFIGQAPVDPAPADRRQLRCSSIDDAANRKRALELWREAIPIAGTLGEFYLHGRGLAVPDGASGRVLRFHPACPFGPGAKHPCMVALFRDIETDEPQAIQRTALTSAGKKISRMTLGPKAGATVKLSADEAVTHRLTVGEGVETTIAGKMLGYAPAWAIGDAGELARFAVLNGVEALTILVDHDQSGTGQRAALECSARWTAAGREVFRFVPRRIGDDVNDLLARKPHHDHPARGVSKRQTK
jgi:hypothetical protein